MLKAAKEEIRQNGKAKSNKNTRYQKEIYNSINTKVSLETEKWSFSTIEVWEWTLIYWSTKCQSDKEQLARYVDVRGSAGQWNKVDMKAYKGNRE